MKASALRTLGGQSRLLAATLVVAVAIGIGIGTERAVFEGLVREKYSPVSVPTLELAARIEGGTATDAELRALDPLVMAELYAAWMTRTAAGVDSPMPAALMKLDPLFFQRQVERTLAGGTLDQRRRALLFIRASRAPEFAAALRWAVRRAREIGDEQFEREALAAGAEIRTDRSENP